MSILKKNLFAKITAIIIIAEILSFISFSYNNLSPLIFGLISVFIIISTVYKLQYGIMIVFVELIIGSLGNMFVLELYGWDFSIRMLIWFVVMAVWLARSLQDRRVAFLKSKMFKPYLAFAIILIWGGIFGLIRNNGLNSIFLDLNNYLYFILILPIFGVLRSKSILHKLFNIICITLVWLSVKTIALFYIFSHEFFTLQDSLYAWSRNSRLAEITNMDPNILTSRIFMQSHIWLMFGTFLFLGLLFHAYIQTHKKAEEIPMVDKFNNRIRPIKIITLNIFVVIFITAIITSFSRSFWLAGVIAFVIMLAGVFFFSKERIRSILGFGAAVVGIVVVSVGLTLTVANFPIPKGDMSASFLKDRASKFTGEAAVSSRYSQIKPLFEEISNHPVLGSGFGTSVTYESQDPRVLKNNPDGMYTTTAFELGWLEIWLKTGLLGVLAYLYIMYKIVRIGMKRIKKLPYNAIASYHIYGGLLGLIVIAITHSFSPYLNHPLGIGTIMLMTAVVDRSNNDQD